MVEEGPVVGEEGPVVGKEGPVSLFIAVYSFTHQQVSIIRLETPEQDDIKRNMDDQRVVRFISPPAPPVIRWYVSPATSSADDFYLLPSCLLPPLHSYQFNFKTGSFQIIKPPLAHKSDGFVVNLGRRTYFMSALNKTHVPLTANIDFECYNPDQNSWEALKPFPTNPKQFRIMATAVWGDNILFNANLYAMWVYNVTRNEWFQVQVDNLLCYRIVGEAVLVGDTFYALTDGYLCRFNTVLALTIKMEGSGVGDLVFKCSILSEISVPGLDPILDADDSVWFPTRNLFHLGQENFCHVQTCVVEGFKGYLYIQLTYMELTGESTMIVTKERMHKLKIQDREKFQVVQCFFLPDCKSTALGEGKRFDFKVYPHENTSVYVRRLPRDATVEQVEEGLNVFGPIPKNGIQVHQIKKSKCYAIVDFESVASKQRAIEAKTVFIGGCEAELYEEEEVEEEEEETTSL